MANFTAGTSFSDGVTNDVTAAKLNALVADAVPTSNLSLNSTTGTIGLFSSGTGTAATPAIQPTGDTNTGIFFPAADTLAATTNGTERLRIDSNGNIGIGTTTPTAKLNVNGTLTASGTITSSANINVLGTESSPLGILTGDSTTGLLEIYGGATNRGGTIQFRGGGNNGDLRFLTGTTGTGTESLRIDSSGVVLIGKSSTLPSVAGVLLDKTANEFTVAGSQVMNLNRLTSDGTLIAFFQDNTLEGTISVAGTTVSYNGGHLSRWSQLLSGQRDASIKKGTVMSNLNEMCEWFDKDGNLLPNEQLNKVKVSDIEGESNVAGVFVNWDDDDKDNPFDLNMAMTGDMIIRIAQGTSVNRGDLLVSAGNGTAKPQGDDIIRSKTIAKVTSTNVTCTYEDGSYCVPCVLMAC